MAGRPVAPNAMVWRPVAPSAQAGLGGASRRRRVRLQPQARASPGPSSSAEALQPEARPLTQAWAPKWRKLLTAQGSAPTDFTEFDRTVRGMLNRISTENARRLLPLEPSLRGGELRAGGDCPQWWATRFAALMLNSYLQVIHTNRFARGLAVRSADNVLPEYLDAIAPLLSQSPRLVTALMAWFASQLEWHDLCWPTTRLLLLAAREERDREALPAHSLGRLPAELLRGRVLSFLSPPSLPAVAGLLNGSAFSGDLSPVLEAAGTDIIIGTAPPSPTASENETIEDKKDIVAVLVHLIMFSPLAIWPRLSAFGFSLAETSLGHLDGHQEVQQQIYLAASVIAALAQRMEVKASIASLEEIHRHYVEELGPLSRLVCLLEEVTEGQRQSATLSTFVDCRTQVAIEHVRRVQESFQHHIEGPANAAALLA